MTKGAKKESKAVMAISRFASLGAIMAVTKLLETDRGRHFSKKVDAKIDKATTEANKVLAVAGSNAKDNLRWTAAGLVAIAIGTAFLARAAKD